MKKIILIVALIMPVFLPQYLYSQLFVSQTTRAYNNFKNNKLDEAYDDFIKILTKDSTSIVSKYGLAQILINPAFDNNSLERAYIYSKQIQRHIIVYHNQVSWNSDITNENLKEIEKNKITPKDIKSINDTIIYKTYQLAIQSKDVYKLKHFISNHSESSYTNYVWARLHELEFIKAKSNNNLTALKRYIQEYPNSNFVESAWSQIHSLAYDSVSKINTKDAYSNFITQYPTAKQIADAQLHIYQFYYDETVKNNTTEAYLAFLRNHPNAPQRKDCYKILNDKLYFTFNGINYHLKDSTLEVIKSNIQNNISIPDAIIVNNVEFAVTSIGDSALIFLDSEDRFENHVKKIQLPSTLRRIGDFAFVWSDYFDSVFIPSNVEYIGFKAFNSRTHYLVDEDNKCYSSLDGVLYNKAKTKLIRCPAGIDSINIPNSVTHIEPYAFEKSNLEHLVIPQNVKVIGKYAFRYSKMLSSILLISGLDSIHEGAFEYCWRMKEVNIPQSISFIGDNVFFCDTKIAVSVNNKNYKSIEGVLFDFEQRTLKRFPGRYMGKYIIPETVKTISAYAFSGCDNLYEVQIPNSVDYIGGRAFSGTLITSIILPKSIRKLDYSAFYRCPYLENTNFNQDTQNKISEQNKIEARQDSLFVSFWENGHPRLRLEPEIEGKVFRNNIQLNIKSRDDAGILIDDNKRVKIVTNFQEKSLKNLQYGVLLTKENLLDNDLVKEKIIVPNHFTEIDEDAFYDLDNVVFISIPPSVKKIGSYAFAECNNLKHIDLPNTIDSIKSATFYNCKSLLSIEIPNSVTYIGDEAFYGCNSLTKIIIPVSVRYISNKAFTNCNALIEVDPQNPYIALQNGLLIDKTLNLVIRANKDLKGKVLIPYNIKKIGEFAFADCSMVSEIILPESIMTIGAYAFEKCINIKSINLPESIEEIDEFAFNYCSQLESIQLPQKLKNLSKGLFAGCASLKEVKVPPLVTTIYENVFEECVALKTVHITSNVKTIKQFIYKTYVTKDITSFEYTLPIEYIIDKENSKYMNHNGCVYDKEQSVLFYCKSTNKGTLVLPNTIKEISDFVFANCYLLDIIKINQPYILLGNNVFGDIGQTGLLKHIELGTEKITLDKIDLGYFDEFIFEPAD